VISRTKKQPLRRVAKQLLQSVVTPNLRRVKTQQHVQRARQPQHRPLVSARQQQDLPPPRVPMGVAEVYSNAKKAARSYGIRVVPTAIAPSKTPRLLRRGVLEPRNSSNLRKSLPAKQRKSLTTKKKQRKSLPPKPRKTSVGRLICKTIKNKWQ